MDKVVYRQKRLRKEKPGGALVSNLLSGPIAKGAFLILSFSMLYNVLNSIKITSQKLEILNRAEKEVTDLRVKNLELNLKLEEMKDSNYLEVEARDRLNFSGENEVVYVIPDSLIEESRGSLDLILGEGDSGEVISVFEEWKKWLS